LASEKTFDAALHNSLYYLDQAKWKWAEEKQKSEQDIPTMADLDPYLGEWTNSIKRFETLGIKYKITPRSEMEPQSDVAILTRDVSFHAGICRFYPAGTRYCINTGWTSPELSGIPRRRAFYMGDRELFAVAIFLLTIVNLLIFGVVTLFKK
jgi:hypothetical protein